MLLRRSAIVLLVSGVVAARPLTGQLAVEISAGARYSTALVQDSIVSPCDVRPAIAPAVSVTLAVPSAHGWEPQATLDFSTSEMRRHDAGGASAALGRVSTAAFTVGLEHRLPAGFFARIGAGGLKYLPGEHSGMFRQGSGAIAGLGTLALGHALPVGTRYHLAVEARYDVHGFTTPALRDEGFDTARMVHRVALMIRAERRGAP